MHVGFFIVILYMYESSKDNINSYICGLHLYIYIYIYIYVCMYVNFLSWQVEYIDIWQVAYICMYVNF